MTLINLKKRYTQMILCVRTSVTGMETSRFTRCRYSRCRYSRCRYRRCRYSRWCWGVLPAIPVRYSAAFQLEVSEIGYSSFLIQVHEPGSVFTVTLPLSQGHRQHCFPGRLREPPVSLPCLRSNLPSFTPLRQPEVTF